MLGLSLGFLLRSPRFCVALQCPLVDCVGRRREWSCSMSAAFTVCGAIRAFCCCPIRPLAVRSSFWLFRGLGPGLAEAVAAVLHPGCRRQVDLGSLHPSSLRNCNYRLERIEFCDVFFCSFTSVLVPSIKSRPLVNGIPSNLEVAVEFTEDYIFGNPSARLP